MASATKASERGLSSPELYINREVSAAGFIRRVLEEAESPRHPLLERVKFLGFVSRQVDEFFMIRIAGLQEQREARLKDVSPDGLLPSEQLSQVGTLIHELLRDQRRHWSDILRPALAEEGIFILDYGVLTKAQRDVADTYFREQIFPILTPLAVDPAHPFPHISSRSLNLAVLLRDPSGDGVLFARVKVPDTIRRLVPVPPQRGKVDADAPKRHAYVWVEQLIAAHLDMLFPGMEVAASYPFRVLRDADFEVYKEQAGDLLEAVEENVQKRRFGAVVSLSVEPAMPETVRNLLCENLQMDAGDLLELDGPLGLGDLTELTEIDRPDLKDRPLAPRIPAELRRSSDLFAAIARGDLLLHHPYDSFSTVAEFIELAARDPQVLAIKQTLYRVGENSPIVDALLEANGNGKQVAVLVELKARFDEVNNIEWARTLDKAGVHVVYGQVEMKTHGKVALVVRREAGELRRYVHIGTGNYNASTARVYEDYALLTSRPEIGEDATYLFNALTGFSRGLTFRRLLVAPDSLRRGLLQRIEREIERHRSTGRGRLIFKLNSLIDPEFIRALYRASMAGVTIDLIVRGMCSLRPGVPGISDHIRVVSLVGRFLEHSRIYYFANGGEGDDEILTGSADLMQRNLDRRVEVLAPIQDPALRAQLRDVALPMYLADTANARLLRTDGSYERLRAVDGREPFDVQQWFIRHTASTLDPDTSLALRPILSA